MDRLAWPRGVLANESLTPNSVLFWLLAVRSHALIGIDVGSGPISHDPCLHQRALVQKYRSVYRPKYLHAVEKWIRYWLRANRVNARPFFYSGKYAGENPQAANVQQASNGSMTYLGGEEIATGAASVTARASLVLVSLAAAFSVALLWAGGVPAGQQHSVWNGGESRWCMSASLVLVSLAAAFHMDRSFLGSLM
jgi:hypothetical protein